MSISDRDELKKQIRERLEKDRAERKRIGALPSDEKRKERKDYKQSLREERATLKTLAPEERKAKKKILRKFYRVRRRPISLSIWGTVVLVPLLLLAVNLIAALLPESEESAAAREASALIAQQIQAEGTVLLENRDQALPLKGTKVNVFGTRSITPSYGGGGSGSVNSKDAIDLYSALAEEGFQVNEELKNLYTNWRYAQKISLEPYGKKQRKSLFEIILPNIMGVLGTERFEKLDPRLIPEGVIDRATEFSDTAVLVVGSFSREAISTDGYQDKRKEDLILDEREKELLSALNENFENVIVLINSGNPMELGWLNEYENLKSALWIGFPGHVGFRGIAGLLSGRFNPSGRLTDTFTYDVLAPPAAQTLENLTYENLPDEHFINYTEGIYIGYRFFETYYENDEEAYEQTVQYPFGYGLSYTDFLWETLDFEADTEEIQLNVKVTNQGDYAGKDVVQIYYSAPYYKGGIEKSHINLVDYAKTDLLAPGESQTLSLRFDLRDMSSYDYEDREAWILEKGEYVIKIGRNVHDIVHTRDFILEEDLVYKNDSRTGVEIRNLFDEANGDLQYLERDDFDGTLATMKDYDYSAPQSVIEATEFHYAPTMGVMPRFDARNGIALKDLKGLDYDDPKWELFLDQFKLKEMIKMVSAGGWQTIGIERLGIPQTLDYDGPSSIRHYFGKWSTLAFPNSMTVAQTWNSDLQEKMGESVALEGTLRDVYVWYAPGMNIHRSALGSRAFEYFSEDPVVSGKSAAALINGAERHGMTVTIKHFAMNNHETNRTGVFTWANEQSMREIYLKSFEISVKEANPHGAMSAMNRIGLRWCGDNSVLLNDLLREEWGFRGFVVTDITIGGYMKASKCITNGNDLMLFLTSGGHEKDIKEAYEIDPVGIARGLRTSVHNICYMVLQTGAMKNVR